MNKIYCKVPGPPFRSLGPGRASYSYTGISVVLDFKDKFGPVV